CGPIRMERFSPYFETPEAWGIRILEPDAAYAYIYPAHVDRARLAYEFEHEAPDTLPIEAHTELIAYVNQWKEWWPPAPPGPISSSPTSTGTADSTSKALVPCATRSWSI